MSNQASAGRYAKALLDVAIKEADPVKAEQDLSTIADLFQKNADLRKAFENPAVPVQAKRAVVEQLVARLKPAAPLGKLLVLLADRDRLDLLSDLAAAYRERLMDYQKVVRAEVITALPLPDAHAKQLQDKLARVTGRTVTMSTKVDPSILGGVVARVGRTVYDGSLATQLQRMRDKLVENT
jgi:F-type H+-transporting ATPase subunit delta